MKKLNLSIAAVLAMGTLAFAGGNVEVAPEPVMDKSGFYFGLAYSYVDVGLVYDDQNNGFDVDVSTSMTTFLAGYQFNQYFAVEGRYTPQFGTFTDNLNGMSVTIDLSNIALYAKGMYAFGNFTVYGLLGYGQTTLGLDITGMSIEDQSETAFQWGLGASYALSEHTSLFVDYTQLYDDTGFDQISNNTAIDAYTLNTGLSYKF